MWYCEAHWLGIAALNFPSAGCSHRIGCKQWVNTPSHVASWAEEWFPGKHDDTIDCKNGKCYLTFYYPESPPKCPSPHSPLLTPHLGQWDIWDPQPQPPPHPLTHPQLQRLRKDLLNSNGLSALLIYSMTSTKGTMSLQKWAWTFMLNRADDS